VTLPSILSHTFTPSARPVRPHARHLARHHGPRRSRSTRSNERATSVASRDETPTYVRVDRVGMFRPATDLIFRKVGHAGGGRSGFGDSYSIVVSPRARQARAETASHTSPSAASARAPEHAYFPHVLHVSSRSGRSRVARTQVSSGRPS
jgi:hypothetical protein